MRILGLSGSLREGSLNTRLLHAAAALAPPAVTLEQWAALASVPPYSEDAEAGPAPVPVRCLRVAIARSDALLVATPEYNRSLPGQLKNALDWASRPFPHNVLRKKPAAAVGASTGPFGAVWALAELQKVLGASGARVLERTLALPTAAEAFDEEGRLRDPRVAEDLRELLHELEREITHHDVRAA